MDMKKYIKTPAFALIAGVVIFIIMVFILDSKSVQGMFSNSKMMNFKEGDIFSYDIKSIALTKDKKNESISLNGESELTANLAVKIYEMSHGTVYMGMQINNMDYEINSKDIPKEYIDMYSIPFLVTLNLNGKIEDVLYSNSISTEDEEVIQNIIQNFNMEYRSLEKVWETKEGNTLGTYRAKYTNIDENSVKKSILNYSSYNKPIVIDENNNSSVFKINFEKNWIDSVVLKEEYLLEFEGFSQVNITKNQFKAKKSFMNVSGIKLLEFETKEELIDFLTKEKEKEKKTLADRIKNKEFEDTVNAKNLKGVDFIKLYLDGKLSKHKLKKELIKYLRLYPDRASEFFDIIYDDLVSNEIAYVIIAALVDVGHGPAQKVLSDIISEVKIDTKVRQNASIMIGFLKNPNDNTIEFLKTFHKINKGDDSMITSSALLAVGNLGNKSEDTYSKVSEYLKSELGKAKDLNEIGLAINSLGNTKHKNIIESIEPFASHEEELVRKATIKSLGRVKDADKQTIEIIHRTLETETSTVVVAQIGSSLVEKDVEEEVVKTLSEKLSVFQPHEMSVDPVDAIKTVVKNKQKVPESRVGLLEMMTKSFDPRVKNEIIKGLK